VEVRDTGLAASANWNAAGAEQASKREVRDFWLRFIIAVLAVWFPAQASKREERGTGLRSPSYPMGTVHDGCGSLHTVLAVSAHEL
jgi:hypothetical protein